jgi:hypothetical protein
MSLTKKQKTPEEIEQTIGFYNMSQDVINMLCMANHALPSMNALLRLNKYIHACISKGRTLAQWKCRFEEEWLTEKALAIQHDLAEKKMNELFNSLFGNFGAIIAGDYLLQFLSGKHHHDCDIDVFIPMYRKVNKHAEMTALSTSIGLRYDPNVRALIKPPPPKGLHEAKYDYICDSPDIIGIFDSITLHGARLHLITVYVEGELSLWQHLERFYDISTYHVLFDGESLQAANVYQQIRTSGSCKPICGSEGRQQLAMDRKERHDARGYNITCE